MSASASRTGIDRRRFMQLAGLGLAAGLDAAPAAGAEARVLYNGVRLPEPWPPRTAPVPDPPVPPAYLRSPPAVVPIDVGRQLFVDDFLVAHSTLTRTYHLAKYHPASPVLRPDKPWEAAGSEGPIAMPFSDGVWYDPKDRLFKMWYMAGWELATAYAVSEDGLRWKKPGLGVRRGTNVVQGDLRDSSTVWLDQEEHDPARRFKMFRSYSYKRRYVLSIHSSPDGIRWTDVALRTGSCGDRSTVFWNPFRKVWVFSLRHGWGLPRARRYWECHDLLAGPLWDGISQPPMWTGADRLDPQRADLRVPAQLYNLDAVAYESLLLGLFSIWRGQPKDRQKPNDIVLGYSRDGWSWDRPDRRVFCPVSDRLGDWNFSNVQSAGGCCLVVGDKLYFYVSGRAGERGNSRTGACSTGLAVLRRDGFASMDADARGGTLTTRPVRFRGQHLFVNVNAPHGELRAEVLDERGQVIAPFTRDRCAPVRADGTKQPVRWDGTDSLAAVVGKPVAFRFHLTDGRLYAFWVSGDRSGTSNGYVAAGGPGYAGLADGAGVPSS